MNFWKWVFVGFLCLMGWCNVVVVQGFSFDNASHISFLESYEVSNAPNQLMVPLTLIYGAARKGAVCLDGTLPGYHLHRGYGSGANSWLIQLEGGGWCNNCRTCVYRKTIRRGSSKFMEKQLAFTGILSNKAEENPANQGLLSGCTAGGLASILHCDECAALFSGHTKVKCLSDAGLFLDAMDVSGGRTLRSLTW